MKTVTDFIFLRSRTTADGDCSHEIKRCLFFRRKAMTNLDSLLKSRDITLLTKVCMYSQSYGFSSSHVWMWELDHKEVWALKHWCFWTVVDTQTIRSTIKELQGDPTSQSWRKSVLNTHLEGLMLKLNFQYFGHLMWRIDSEKTLMLGKIESRRRRRWQRM